MRVGHEADERALKTSAQATEQHEARFGELHRTLEVNNAQIYAKIPVCFEFEIERGRRAPTTHLGVIVFIFADRRGFGRNVRNREDELFERRLGLFVQIGVVGDLLFELRDLPAFATSASSFLPSPMSFPMLLEWCYAAKQRFLLRDRAATIFVEL